MGDVRKRSDLSERAKIFLAASVGEISVTDACLKLGITRQRFYELEERAVSGYARELEPKPPGRPPKLVDPTAELGREIDGLKRENQKLWKYVQVLRHLAGIEDEGKKRRRKKTDRDRGEANDR